MKLRNLSIESLEIPFKVSFQHSAANRTTTEAVIVKAQTTRGHTGMGEGCPRSYVTGESVDTAIEFFGRHRNDFLEISSLSDLEDWIKESQQEIDENPAAFCALELALLNVLATENDKTLEQLLELPDLSGEFRYTGVLGTASPNLFQGLLNKYLEMEIQDFKIKLFGDFAVDRKNIDAIRNCNNDQIRVRFDANNLWSDSLTASRYLDELNYPVFAIEEPLIARDYVGFFEVSRCLEAAIILDESFTRTRDFDSIQTQLQTWIINIRISKMGGILRSVSIAKQANALGIPVIIGAQVGETSILTRAAISVANTFRQNLVAQEGGLGTLLLERDLISPPIMFGQGGVIQSQRL